MEGPCTSLRKCPRETAVWINLYTLVGIAHNLLSLGIIICAIGWSLHVMFHVSILRPLLSIQLDY